MTVKKTNKHLVTEVYLEDVMQALTETGNACMQHLRAGTNTRTSFILCLPVGIITFKHNRPRPIILVMFGGICVSVSVSVLSAPGCVCKNAGEKMPQRVHLKLSVRPKPDVLPSDVRYSKLVPLNLLTCHMCKPLLDFVHKEADQLFDVFYEF